MKTAVVFLALISAATLLNIAEARCRSIDGYVYILMEKTPCGRNGNLYKIGGVEGESNEVDRRRGQLQTGNPRQLVVLKRYATRNCQAAEIAAQDAVSHNRVRYGGGTEWFRLNNAGQFYDFERSVKNAVGRYSRRGGQRRGRY